MSAEKIIEQIKNDSTKEIKKIQKEKDNEIKNIIESAKKQGKIEAEEIIKNGEKQAQNHKKILISQVNQDSKRKIMNAKEEVINKCFKKAQEKLSKIEKKDYQKIIEVLINKGKKRISGKIKVYISRESDKKFVEKIGLKLAGKIESIGGIILTSDDSKITIDNTFEGILKREKEEIRNKIGKMLFSN